LNLRDVPRHRIRRNQIFVAECRGYLPAIDVALGAVALDCAKSAGKACGGVPLGGVFYGEGKIVVGACRGRSRAFAACHDIGFKWIDH
jgi:hypothetical protein